MCKIIILIKGGFLSRKALVIGNADYIEKPLITPYNDAEDIASLLAIKNFEVTMYHDLKNDVMDRAIRTFVDSINDGIHIVLFYFAGHGVQIDGKNYLLPVGQTFSDETHIKYSAYPLDELLERLEKNKKNTNIIILDACRNNPFSNHRSLFSSGLAETIVSQGSCIAFATSPGNTASDTSCNNRNGLYTSHLLNALNIVGLSFDERFKLVRENVFIESQEKQMPWISNSIIGNFDFDTKQDEIKGLPTVFRDVSKFEISEYKHEDNFNHKYINRVSNWEELIGVLEVLCSEGHGDRPFCLEVLRNDNIIEPLLCVTSGGNVDYGFGMITIENFLENHSDYGCFSNSHVLKSAKKAPIPSELYVSINFGERISASELISWPTILWNIHSTDNQNLGVFHSNLIDMIKAPPLKYPTLGQLQELMKKHISSFSHKAYVKIEIDNIYENDDFEKYIKSIDEYILTGYCYTRKQFIGVDKRYNLLPDKSEWLTYLELKIILDSMPEFQLKEKLHLNLIMGIDWDEELMFEEHDFFLGHLNSKLLFPE